MLCGVAVLALGCLAASAHVLHGLGGGGGWMPAAACADPPANSSLHGVCAAASDAQVRSWSAAAGASACSSALAVAASLYAVCTWRQAPRALFAVGATALSLLLLSPTAVATYTGHTVDGHLVFGGLKAGAAAFYLVRGGSAASCRWCGGGAAVRRCGGAQVVCGGAGRRPSVVCRRVRACVGRGGGAGGAWGLGHVALPTPACARTWPPGAVCFRPCAPVCRGSPSLNLAPLHTHPTSQPPCRDQVSAFKAVVDLDRQPKGPDSNALALFAFGTLLLSSSNVFQALALQQQSRDHGGGSSNSTHGGGNEGRGGQAASRAWAWA